VPPASPTGVVFFAHGSSIETANQAVREVARAAAERGRFELWETAFLEGGRPGLPEAVAALVGRGARRIVIVPYFLTLGLHLQRDLPRIAEDLARIHKDTEILCGDPLDGHPALAEILAERAREASRRHDDRSEDSQPSGNL
jgi:sirohydrochlorin ferrochelatase